MLDSIVVVRASTHTHTHMHRHTYTHTHTHTHTQLHMRTPIHKHRSHILTDDNNDDDDDDYYYYRYYFLYIVFSHQKIAFRDCFVIPDDHPREKYHVKISWLFIK